ncbi:unnamed protein product [Protopolystoma xenopodis]|uniref:Uncharacterized protein n=1 Tax=Protopolystoma xenopodis TaxID=117903 RepID=A0A3S5BDH8_9PLAT|nr:unnamed protein product [Protopolystoma xenopodis]
MDEMNLINGTSKMLSVLDPALHPSAEAAASILIERFNLYTSSQYGQALLTSQDKANRLLSLLPPDLHVARDELAGHWSYSEDFIGNESEDSRRQKVSEEAGLNQRPHGVDLSVKRWNTLKTFLAKTNRQTVTKTIALNYLYPRLDVNVTTGGPKHI